MVRVALTGVISSVGEHLPYKQGSGFESYITWPDARYISGQIVGLIHEGRGFESHSRNWGFSVPIHMY